MSIDSKSSYLFEIICAEIERKSTTIKRFISIRRRIIQDNNPENSILRIPIISNISQEVKNKYAAIRFQIFFFADSIGFLTYFDLEELVPFFSFKLKKNLFQECEASLNHKTELIKKLEAKTLSMTETFQKLDEQYVCLSFIIVKIVHIAFIRLLRYQYLLFREYSIDCSHI